MTEALRNASFGIALWKALSEWFVAGIDAGEQDKKGGGLDAAAGGRGEAR